MWLWSLGVGLFLVAAFTLGCRHRRKRNRILSALAHSRDDAIRGHQIQIRADLDRVKLSDYFQRERIIRIDDFLTSDCLARLRCEAEENIPRMVPSYIPTHKKGHTLSYENIHRHAHACLAFYHSEELRKWICDVVGLSVHPTPDRDQSSLSVLCYKDAGDHINWHFDHNFYKGRHFTVLLSLANESRTGGLSASQLMRRTPSGDEIVETAPNTLVIFEGAKVLHRASATAEGDLRIMLSMTFCEDSSTNLIREAARRIKDTAFFGLRALWD